MFLCRRGACALVNFSWPFHRTNGRRVSRRFQDLFLSTTPRRILSQQLGRANLLLQFELKESQSCVSQPAEHYIVFDLSLALYVAFMGQADPSGPCACEPPRPRTGRFVDLVSRRSWTLIGVSAHSRFNHVYVSRVNDKI